ncbi:MAG: hypothetical protein UV00_C0010G0003 [candidate division WWE3 bacterium GW2011_GWF1_42_14]|uniref:Uncharacterized protein n=1 Tax=candidate division WWE3 bacterium GW2011_GWF1_42_14 TaxID=1619138 RepID=A0A0G1AV13_UNCKA|nr:MAG: hypothetical protein UU92_C0011G0002 [candidate division WWE3 bacterium GW2011_GWA1_42_12]KKS34454.1 MAG: hypothetical protein UU97_C0010G0001 [candidate division WWE3 bacterium GW2011_GWD1_42_14]KKS37931.1 MAG: hypothetical protein UV00_C0010G0003 [candidate division WWE3 bacterium GW2011_GWF1_42_14]KKS40238.1 MAG: hypothetical protein UV03_C0009G0001 [candidate division WWE3 bacterium GW2011_GWE1_42_16]
MYDSFGVEIRVFRTAANARATLIGQPQPTDRLRNNSMEFGLVTIRLANNEHELEKFNGEFYRRGYSTNFVLMRGRVVLSYTDDYKKALKFLKGSDRI